MIDFVKQLELENYLADEPIDPLAKMLDELISKGEYKWINVHLAVRLHRNLSPMMVSIIIRCAGSVTNGKRYFWICRRNKFRSFKFKATKRIRKTFRKNKIKKR